ncbi:hypothetical protein [Spirosoma rhododendri]|uniref:Lipoprotein n=1 Tax=Spirosoma rhododendri TaxID=2728024 RepID=A0A7L5DRY6_9BACT|nr:hypothetical protein [Spirosoma rhododendri]QJD79328.1 hypothetical protein HH216_13575 [Spirosoma rhododendri]
MKLRYIFLAASLSLASCATAIGPETAPYITGSYSFAEYTTATASDIQPIGTAVITATDDSHVSILVKGTSGKTRISYSYSNVSVNGPGPDMYTLLYKGKPIGEAGNDGLNRYLTLTPTSSIILKAIEY